MTHVFALALSLNSPYSLHGAAPFVVRLWDVFAKTTSPHGSRFVNSQLMMAHLRKHRQMLFLMQFEQRHEEAFRLARIQLLQEARNHQGYGRWSGKEGTRSSAKHS
jgi:hypothetical protein